MIDIEGRGPSSWRDDLLELAEAAGDAIMEVYRNADLDTEYKEDDSPLTKADLRSQEIIASSLREATPSLPLLAEESEETPYEERKDWDRFWMVDPLDGTKEFLKQNGEFTVNIAVIEEGSPILGVVHAPAMGVSWWAVEGEGAYKRTESGEDVPLEVEDPEEGPLTVVVSRSHINDETQAYADRLAERSGREIDLMPVGSALKLCMVAEGEAHVYPRLAPTMEWDIGAAHCVVEEAGGFVQTVEGEPLRYNKPELLNPHFVVASSEEYLSV
jgi:3'(2'), 5'-bisphosphate nucleotidase